MTWRLLGLYLISCLFYIKFISGEFNNLIYTIRTLFNQMLKNTEATKFSGNQLVQATGEALYGNVVQISSYVLWGLFLLFSMFYLVMILTEKKRDNLKFFASFSALLLCTFINIFTGVLSLGRLYFFGIVGNSFSYGGNVPYKGISADFKEAAKWYQMAAMQGDEEGASMLGRVHSGERGGFGVERDQIKMYVWYIQTKWNEQARNNFIKQFNSEQLKQAEQESNEIKNKIKAQKDNNFFFNLLN